jgi:hypothetical protein
MLAVAAAQGGSTVGWVVAAGLIAFGGTTALMSLSKLNMIKFVLSLLLGFCVWRPRPRLLLGAVIGLAIAYVSILSPLVSLGRTLVDTRGLQNLQSARGFLEWYFAGGREEAGQEHPGVQAWWTRLAYAPAQAFAMDAYDRAEPGDSILLAAWTIVPRWAYPSKPMLSVGREFTRVIRGTDSESHTAPGLAAEGYWNFGWVGTIGVGLCAGFFLGGMGAMSVRWMRRGQLVLLPVVWMGIGAGLQPDSWFAATYVGSATTALFLYCGLRLLSPLILTKQLGRRKAVHSEEIGPFYVVGGVRPGRRE